jgi:uncharacterized protein YjiS (DUF1127 family)
MFYKKRIEAIEKHINKLAEQIDRLDKIAGFDEPQFRGIYSHEGSLAGQICNLRQETQKAGGFAQDVFKLSQQVSKLSEKISDRSYTWRKFLSSSRKLAELENKGLADLLYDEDGNIGGVTRDQVEDEIQKRKVK